jgi:hypothetical protein
MRKPPEDRVKVRFALDQDSDGWPLVASEGVWARACGDAEYELDNVPWFARGIALGDRVHVEPEEDAAGFPSHRSPTRSAVVSGEVPGRQERVTHDRSTQVRVDRPGEVSPRQVRSSKASMRERCAGQIGTADVRTVQICAGEVRRVKVCAGEVGLREVCARQSCSRQVDACKVGANARGGCAWVARS